MIVAIHQPHYLPWLRYVDKIARSDVFVLLDDVQYTKNGWQNRNRIKTVAGWMYLTVPVRDAFEKPIHEVCINAQDRWREKHRQALRTNYARAPHFLRYMEGIDDVYTRPWELLHEVNLELLRRVLFMLGISTALVRSSDLGVGGRGTERLIEICKRVGARRYLTGDYAATNHLDVAAFADNGIVVHTQSWHCAEYPQQFTHKGFIPDLSILDLLFNEGPAALGVLARSHPHTELSAV